MQTGFHKRCGLYLAGAVWAHVCLLQAALMPLERSFTVQRWTADDGLPGNSIRDIGDGPDGLLWGVSGSAIWRFDGARFVTTPAAFADHPDKGKTIKSFELTRDGRFYIQTRWEASWFKNGMWARDVSDSTYPFGGHVMTFMTSAGVWNVMTEGLLLRNGSETVVFRGPEEMRKAGGIFTWAAPDASGSNVWVTATTGLYRFSDGHFTAVEVTDTRETNFERVCVGASGQVWLYGHPDRFYVLRQGVWERLPTPVGEWPVRMGAEAMAERNGNELWAGTADGLFRWDGREWGRLELGGLVPPGVVALHVGKEGEVWAGLEGGGLLCLRERRIKMVRAPDGPAVQAFSAVYERQDGVLYAGIENAGLWSGPLDRLQRMDIPKFYNKATVLAIAEDAKGGLLIGPTGGSLLRYCEGATDLIFPGKNAPWMDYGVRSLLVEPSGRIWVGTQRGLMFEKGNEAELRWFSGSEQYAVNALRRTADGVLWAASDGHGVFSMAPDGTCAFEMQAERLVPFADVRALLVDSRGRLWAGGLGGLAYRGDDGVWHLSDTQRLGTVVQILEDASGALWIGTLKGIARIVSSDGPRKVNWFGREDGLDSEVCSGGFGNAGCRLRDGRLLFPTQDGLAVVDPQRLTPKDTIVDPLLDEVLADGRAVWQKNPFGSQPGFQPGVTVPAGTHVVTIRYLASNPTEGRTVLFRHRLGDASATWSPWTTSREAVFDKLQPDLYPFSLQAMTRDGQVADLVQAPAIRMLPLWWQRRSVQAAGVAWLLLALGTGIWRLARRRMRRRLEQVEREQSVQRERARIAQDLHDDLGASLTHISWLSDAANRDDTPIREGRVLLGQISAKSRDVLRSFDEIVWAVNPKNDTLENLINYISQFAVEFFHGHATHLRFDVVEPIPAHPLVAQVRHNLFLVLKEAVNNAAKHAGASEVWIRCKMESGSVQFIIEDDGRGFDPAVVAKGDGLSNMRLRASRVGAELHVRSLPGTGTCVTINVPLRTT